ncbi:sigma-70 family RNA polymerase sigma factor [Pseudoflavitalea sp. X16]|uniref:RNA polymerase sigma factor n=1 Tax=Paraflavitalea devenefica TaxID=2716334 RepID=UPI001420B8EC|nr:sigma-70 family RNA polymerase sigma factor [Paraflavitalea devenefica]NII27907.1 sigma-70 family RNA polymerase sigma factor [Paraflavitalea devenefica]
MSENDAQADQDWLQRLQCSDEQALAALMKKYYTDLYSYASRFTKDEGLIKDCIQEVFISLWQRRDTAAPILSLRYYLLRAAKNKVLKSLHRKVYKTDTLDGQESYDFYQEFSVERFIIEKQVSEEKAAALRNILQQLSKRQHEVIYLKFYQRLDHGQIADLMNISRQSVYNLLHEALQKLHGLWHAEYLTK